MKICQSRKSTHSIMNNGGTFGHMIIRRGEFAITVPNSFLFSDGRMKKYAIQQINKAFAMLESENNRQAVFTIKELKVERVEDIA